MVDIEVVHVGGVPEVVGLNQLPHKLLSHHIDRSRKTNDLHNFIVYAPHNLQIRVGPSANTQCIDYSLDAKTKLIEVAQIFFYIHDATALDYVRSACEGCGLDG